MGPDWYTPGSRIARRFGSDKLYICLSNKCFKVYPVYSLCTDVRPSQDHRIIHMQLVQINLAATSKLSRIDYTNEAAKVLATDLSNGSSDWGMLALRTAHSDAIYNQFKYFYHI